MRARNRVVCTTWALLTIYLALFTNEVQCKGASDAGYGRTNANALGKPIRLKWHVLGPFSVGKTEVDGRPWAPFIGGEESHPAVNQSAVFYSELVSGGIVKWREVPRQSGDQVVIEFPQANWNVLVQTLSSMTVLSMQALVTTEFTVPKDGAYMVNLRGAHTFHLDDRMYMADIYHDGGLSYPLSLTAGPHRLTMRIRGKAQAMFHASVHALSSSEGFQIGEPGFTPDIITLADGSRALSGPYVPMTFTSEFVGSHLSRDDIQVQSSTPGITASLVPVPGAILPGHKTELVIKLDAGSDTLPSTRESNECLLVTLVISVGKLEMRPSFHLRCRHNEQSYVVPFIDHDGSLSRYAVIRPRELPSRPTSTERYPVFLTLSGVGATPEGQADAHKYVPNKKGRGDFVFGLKRAWIIAPERAGAHNWEGTGILSARAALEHHCSLSYAHAHSDCERLIYDGHSRGGHGALVLATHWPDAALACAVSAGWIGREYYGDANRIFDHDLSMSHTDPKLLWVLEATIAENNVARSVANTAGMPFLLRVGSADQNTAPWLTRRAARLLHEAGAEVDYREVPQQGHWWWNTARTNDGGVVFDDTFRSFFAKALKKSDTRVLPATYTIISLNPASFPGRGGVTIFQLERPFVSGTVGITRSQQQLTLSTKGVRRLGFQRDVYLAATGESALPTSMIIDGVTFDSAAVTKLFSDKHTTRCVRPSVGARCAKWVVDDPGYERRERSPATSGPARQVFARPFVIAYGDRGDVSETSVNQEAAVFIANSHMAAQHTLTTALPESLLTDEMTQSHNIVYVGTIATLSRLSFDNGRLPPNMTFNHDDSSFTLNGCRYHERHGIVATIPGNTRDGLDLIVTGTTAAGLRDVLRYSYASNQALTRAVFTNMAPDFLVTGPHWSWKGMGGIDAAGFWDNDWTCASSLMFQRCG